MIKDKDKQERYTRTMRAERVELRQATRRFIRSLFRTGVSVALLPINGLPREPQHHFRAAGHEFTRGWAALVREFADGIEEIAKETSTPTHYGEDAPPTGEAEASQDT